jgi:cytochrome b ascorbate-dependent protein 3
MHATFHSLAGVFIILGLTFVERFKVTSKESHFFSLHSWVGITAIALYVGQYVAGARLPPSRAHKGNTHH